ncbi:MAG TPA: DUF4268 domain-containing protein, partial [Actinomycetota bacterium]|nr:DUF4268 domain-containing protein [Actinomycetota bacterium]
LRGVWSDEARDFTPWLRENVALLAEALGVELETEGREVAVGPFSADLVAVEPGSGARVVIENQLGQTDHDHLGKLLTYAGGLEGRFAVWIAGRFREEHRQALEWLNEATGPETGFFGVEIELLRIDGSPPAPNFKVVVAPNEPVKAARATAGIVSERGLSYQAFWRSLLLELKERDPGATAASPERVGSRGWFGIPVGRVGFRVNTAFVAGGRMRVELYIDTGDHEANKRAFDLLLERRGEIEGRFGETLHWDRLDHRRASRVYAERPGSIDAPEEELEELRSWAVHRMLRLRDAVAPVIRTLSLQEGVPEPGGYEGA